MNAENPVQIDLFGVSATRTKDTRLAEHIGGSVNVLPDEPVSHSVVRSGCGASTSCYGMSGCRNSMIVYTAALPFSHSGSLLQ